MDDDWITAELVVMQVLPPQVQLPAAHFGNGVTPPGGTNFDLIIDSETTRPHSLIYFFN